MTNFLIESGVNGYSCALANIVSILGYRNSDRARKMIEQSEEGERERERTDSVWHQYISLCISVVTPQARGQVSGYIENNRLNLANKDSYLKTL